MRGFIAIFKKELLSYFRAPLFYVLSGLLCVFFSFLFALSLQQFSQTSQQGMFNPQIPSEAFNIHFGLFINHLSQLNLALLLVVPALTMRLLAEEMKLKTSELLLTAPVTSATIVLSKYLSAVVVILCLSLIALLYPLFTVFFAKIDWAPLMIAFFGIVLVGMVYAAIDLFCSSLSESIIVSYVLAALLNILIWFLGAGAGLVDSVALKGVFEHISLGSHMMAFIVGTIKTSSLVFILSLIAVFLLLTERVLESRRWRI